MLKLKPSFNDLIKSSIKSITKNKGRTFLTSLGIIIGVTSVILLVSIGNGLKSFVSEQFESLGSNSIYVMPGAIFQAGGGNPNAITIKFNQNDVSNLKKNLDVAAVIPMTENNFVQIKYLNKTQKTTIIATTYEYAKNMNSIPTQGTWFKQQDDYKKSKVVILGFEVKDKLFGNQNPIGRKINYSGTNLKVIGFLDKKGRGGFGGNNVDNAIYIPLNTSFVLNNNRDIQSIVVKANSTEDIESLKKKIENILKQDYKKEDSFTVMDQSQILSSINTILSALTAALSGIAAISLVVGGIGIMNIMLVTVSERTREIGLRKAIGAHPRAILIQFLIEAIILSGIGGVIGIIVGSIGAAAINQIFPAKITIASVLLAFGVSFGVGIIFGVMPARKASKLSPIEALRYE